MEEINSSSQNDDRLVRPDNTNPCFNSFYVEEENVISVLNKGFYTLCPFCSNPFFNIKTLVATPFICGGKTYENQSF